MLRGRIFRAFPVAEGEGLFAAFRLGAVADRLALPVAVSIAILGVWFRCRALAVPLWLDEAAWAVRLMDDPLRELVLRPIGFMLVERAFARTFGVYEVVLRFLPWLAGVICTVLSVPLGRRLFRSEASRLLFVGMIALDPSAIELSKEFKPYSVSLTIHAAFVFLSLRYFRSGKHRDLAGLLALSFFGVLFAQDAIFAYPGIFALLAIDAFRARRWRHLIATGVVGALTIGLIGGLYVYIWSTLDTEKDTPKWGKKYDIFYQPGKGTKTDWSLRRYADMVESPAARRVRWKSTSITPERIEELAALYGAAFLVLNLAGALQLLRTKKWRECTLLIAPLGVMLGFNLLGFWPFGPFRANLFALVYVAGLAGAAVDREPRKTRALDFAPVAFLVLLPLFVFERGWHATKAPKASSRFPEAMRELLRQHGPATPNHKDALIADAYTCPMYHYYTKYHPTLSRSDGPALLERFHLDCKSDRLPSMMERARTALKPPESRVWVMVSRPSLIDKATRGIPDDLRPFAIRRIGKLHVIVGLERMPTEAAPGPTPEELKPLPQDEPKGDGDIEDAKDVP